jgi:hypothetical protein
MPGTATTGVTLCASLCLSVSRCASLCLSVSPCEPAAVPTVGAWGASISEGWRAALVLIGATTVKLRPPQPDVITPFDRWVGQPPSSSTSCGRSRLANFVTLPFCHANSGPYA